MPGNNVFNDKDTMDINELASLNDDISPELIEQLQQKLSQDAKNLSGDTKKKSGNINTTDDAALFEEPSETSAQTENAGQDSEAADAIPAGTENSNPEVQPEPKPVKAELNFDDNFIKKYKAKLSKQAQNSPINNAAETNTISSAAFTESEQQSEENIEELTNGNITERALTPKQKEYNDSLDYLDGNVKYSKYVIYIEPQNVDFIESLTVKERKNLINHILREQDDISITKARFKIIQTIIRHAIVAILTITISIPVIYFTINASLEATINNYRRSQSIFQTLYRQGGKITPVDRR